MAKTDAILRYRIIVNMLNQKQATFDEIYDRLERESEIQSQNLSVSKRTFQRDLKEIEKIFQIEIRYDFSRMVYYIHSVASPEINDRFFEAFDIYNALNAEKVLSKYVQLEKRPSRGTENIFGILHAIQNRLEISFIYKKYYEDKPEVRTLKPYALKEYRNRWYVVGLDAENHEIRIFGLDRLSDLQVSSKKFRKDPAFDLNKWFMHSFGIIISGQETPEEVFLFFDSLQGEYVKSLPLHHTQEIVKEDKEGLLIKLKVHITHDFIMELLSFGFRMRVVAPDHLSNQIKEHLKKALENYS